MKKGQLFEAENNEPSYPIYANTIHIVEYVGLFKADPDRHLCKMVAFEDDPIYEWSTNELHKMPRLLSHDQSLSIGQKVHVRMRDRTAIDRDGKILLHIDGHQSSRGVWVKATVEMIKNGKKFIFYTTLGTCVKTEL